MKAGGGIAARAGGALLLAGALGAPPLAAAGPTGALAPPFPLPLTAYAGEEGLTTLQVLVARARLEPLNLVATALFLLAILHTFLAPRILAYAHRLAHGKGAADANGKSVRVELIHFFGEIEVVFGLWVLPLLVVISAGRGWRTTEHLMARQISFTEPLFVVVIMTIAATRPVLQATEAAIGRLAALGGRTPFAWWLAILGVGPLLGSFITEPAAMVICALLLGRQIFSRQPGRALQYATLGLLFVSISVGGTLTPFAAPPVLMVAGPWGWGTAFMLRQFGWKAALGIALATAAYALSFRRQLVALAARPALLPESEPDGGEPVPAWIVALHAAFLAWTVVTAHTPALFIGGFLFFLGFTEATAPHQSPLQLRPALLVGFFLAGLVIHGQMQAWWIAPVLAGLGPLPLFGGALLLTAFNDNAAITYLASLVPNLTVATRYAVVAGAVAGGGLTVIANAPNPAGQALLAPYFSDGISPRDLLLGALLPTLIVSACLLLFG